MSAPTRRWVVRGAIAVGLFALLVRLVVVPTGASDPAEASGRRLLHAAEASNGGETVAPGGAPEALVAAAETRRDVRDDGPVFEADLGAGGAVEAHAAVVTGAPPQAAGVVANTVDRRQTKVIERLIQKAFARARELQPSKVNYGNMHVGVHVRERGVPGDLVAIEADRAMRPASNMKLVTSAVALVLLGPGWAFETPFEALGDVRDGRLQGDLVARASGDPLYEKDGDLGAVPAGFAEPLVSALRTAGVERIEGALVLDEGSFVTPAPGPAWPSSNQFDQEYCALSGGFTIGAGSMSARVRSRSSGQAARVEVGPWGHGLREAFDVSTVARKKPLVVHVQARGGRATVRGRIPADVTEWNGRFAHPDPVELFGNVLRSRLVAAGIAVEGGVQRERGVPAGREIARLASPLAATLAPINTDSNNAVADQVFFATGDAVMGSGTRAGGGAATVLALERLGVPTAGLVQVDGAGLSRDNRVSARQITALVDAVLGLDAETTEAFLDSLAVAGRTGTLERRMSEIAGEVRAKTGFIGGTSALSGTVTTADGRELVFSILVDYPVVAGLNRDVWKRMQDQICIALYGADG